MKLNSSSQFRALVVIALILVISLGSRRLGADTGTCGGSITTVPFTDVMASSFFCQIAEAFFSGLSNGTSATTYEPSLNVPREQMAAFVTRTLDQSLKRGSRRATLKQYWTPNSADGLGSTTVGGSLQLVESDGADIWVANGSADTVARVRASDGKLLETWIGATNALGVLAAKGLIFVTGNTSPGRLYQIDPSQPMAAVTTVTASLPNLPLAISFDGGRIWTTNSGSVAIVILNPLNITTVTAGFDLPFGILYDGANMWVTDAGTFPGNLFKLDSNGAIIQTITVGENPRFPVFDGTNIWVPNSTSNTVTVVRASTGAVLATLTGNGLSGATAAAFDGERILVTNKTGNSLSLWKATDLTPLGVVNTGPLSAPFGACSDGLNFWVTRSAGKLARF